MSSTNSFSIQPEKVRAVVFDLGGVLIEGGPSEVVAFGRRIGLDPEKWEVLRREIFGNDSPWARLERGEIDFEHFIATLKARLADNGVEVSDEVARTFLGDPRPLGDTEKLRPEMIDAVRRLKSAVSTALLTNNVREWRSGWREAIDLDSLFDVVIDSSEVGARKPEPKIYEITREKLDVEAGEILFVDDIGQNLKAAHRLGWQTLLFKEIAPTIEVLEAVLAGR